MHAAQIMSHTTRMLCQSTHIFGVPASCGQAQARHSTMSISFTEPSQVLGSKVRMAQSLSHTPQCLPLHTKLEHPPRGTVSMPSLLL